MQKIGPHRPEIDPELFVLLLCVFHQVKSSGKNFVFIQYRVAGPYSAITYATVQGELNKYWSEVHDAVKALRLPVHRLCSRV